MRGGVHEDDLVDAVQMSRQGHQRSEAGTVDECHLGEVHANLLILRGVLGESGLQLLAGGDVQFAGHPDGSAVAVTAHLEGHAGPLSRKPAMGSAERGAVPVGAGTDRGLPFGPFSIMKPTGNRDKQGEETPTGSPWVSPAPGGNPPTVTRRADERDEAKKMARRLLADLQRAGASLPP